MPNKQHIKYQFSGLEVDDTEDDDGDDYYGYDGNDDGELSFDYGQNDQSQNALPSSRNSMEVRKICQIFSFLLLILIGVLINSFSSIKVGFKEFIPYLC